MLEPDDVAAQLRAAGCVFAEDEAALLLEAAGGSLDTLTGLLRARIEGAPLEPLVGWVAFAGRRIGVAAGVFVPRRRTELLARLALGMLEESAPATSGTRVRADSRSSAATATAADEDEDEAEGAADARADADARPDAEAAAAAADSKAGGTHPAGASAASPAAVVVELCCGVAPVATTIAGAIEAADAEIHAADIDPAAVEVARRNLAPLGGEVWCGDLFDALPERLRGRIDVLAANAPYVPSAAVPLMPREARRHEPSVALDGGPDGLDVATRVIAAAPAWLTARGALLIETSARQAADLAGRMGTAGFATRIVRDDEVDGTVVVGRRQLS